MTYWMLSHWSGSQAEYLAEFPWGNVFCFMTIHFMMWLQKLSEFTLGKICPHHQVQRSLIYLEVNKPSSLCGLGVSQHFCASMAVFRIWRGGGVPFTEAVCVVMPASVTHLPLFCPPWYWWQCLGTCEPARMAACPEGLQLSGFFPGIPLPSTTFSASMRSLLRASS